MKLSRTDRQWANSYADANSVSRGEIQKAIVSFFDDMLVQIRKLPFDNARRIYTHDAIEERAPVFNIPSLGRIGPVYASYLKWRREEALNEDMELRETVKTRYRDERIEEAAKLAKEGKRITNEFFRNIIPSGAYKKVWFIDKGGKRKVAKQVYKIKK